MQRILVFGNSGSGKSTLARLLSTRHDLAHLDLDTVAWHVGTHPQRKPLNESMAQIEDFIAGKTQWIIEGCYADLLELLSSQATEMIFLNPGIDACIQNCKKRPWEAHKYSSLEAQQRNLEMLINWLSDYARRDDEYSLTAHRNLLEGFPGKKKELSSNEWIDDFQTVEIVAVENDEMINTVSVLANEIWHEHFVPIIGVDQVVYMLEKFQSPAAINAQIASGASYFLAYFEGQASGYMSLIPDASARSMMISKFYVSKRHRQRGVATSMLRLAESMARSEKSISKLWLTVNRRNILAIDWYQKHGFSKTEKLKKDIGAGFYMDDFIMEKEWLNESL